MKHKFKIGTKVYDKAHGDFGIIKEIKGRHVLCEWYIEIECIKERGLPLCGWDKKEFWNKCELASDETQLRLE